MFFCFLRTFFRLHFQHFKWSHPCNWSITLCKWAFHQYYSKTIDLWHLKKIIFLHRCLIHGILLSYNCVFCFFKNFFRIYFQHFKWSHPCNWNITLCKWAFHQYYLKIRVLWQLKIIIFLHSCLIHDVLLSRNYFLKSSF